MESGNERQNPNESSIIESGYQSLIPSSKPREKDSIVGPFGDSPNKNDRQRKKLLSWLKETQQKRDENNKRIFCRWLGMVEKGSPTSETKPQVVTATKSEHSTVKTEYSTTPKVHSIPYDAFYTMAPVYYTYSTPDYYMLGPEQQNVTYFNNYVQRTPCLCYPYCYQNQTSTLPSCEVQLPTGPAPPTHPPPPPPPQPQAPVMTVMSKDSQKQQDALQFNLSEWYTALEDSEVDGGSLLDNLQPNDTKPGQSSLDFSSISASNSGPVAYSVSSLVSVTSQPGDFS